MKKLLPLIFTLLSLTALPTTTAQTYDPYAVQVINNLIANNGLNATPNAPETWGFAKWNEETPKKLIELNFRAFGLKLSGAVSFAKLTSLKLLDCSFSIPLKEIDVTGCSHLQTLLCFGIYHVEEINISGCTQLRILNCSYNLLSKLDLADCLQLTKLECFYNKLTELDVSNCSQLQVLDCGDNNLEKLNLKNNKSLDTLNIWKNCFTKLDLTGLNNLTEFLDMDQHPEPIILYKNEGDEYSCPIMLNNPTFTSNAISYSDGVLKSYSNTVNYTDFTIQTGKQGHELVGKMQFIYSNGDISEYDSLAVKRINDMIAHNGLKAKPNAPETWWKFATWNKEMPKKILELALYELTGTPSFEGLSSLERLHCGYTGILGLNVRNCLQLNVLVCPFNKISELNLTGLNNLENFFGHGQEISLTLHENETGEYTCAIPLNNPTFSSHAISYADGILKSTDNTVSSTSFTVKTMGKDFELSGEMQFTYSNVGIESIDGKEIKVYPNPTTGELTIENGPLTITGLEIFDVNGKKQFSIFNSQFSIEKVDISHLPAGVYLVKLFTEQGEIVKKIVKQ